jgi:TetR/AcrR family tetracycline transcriptional repressor
VSRAGLTRERIVRRALELADAEGLDAASFRRLAADLGVTPMALYRHVEDRDDLLAAMTDLVIDEIEVPDVGLDTRDDWALALREVLRSAVAAYTRHPAARALSSTPRLSARSAALTEAMIQLLAGAGFSERESLIVIQRLSDAALAETWALPGQSVPGFPGLEAAVQQTAPEDPRAFGIDVVIAGVKALAAERRPKGPPSARPRRHG